MRCRRVRGFYKRVERFQFFSPGQGNIARITDLFCPRRFQSAAHSKDTGRGHIAFQQCVGGLCRTVGDKNHFFRRDAAVAHEALQYSDNPFRHAFPGSVGGGQFFQGDDFAGFVINSHGICEGSAHVDADPYRSHVLLPPSLR